MSIVSASRDSFRLLLMSVHRLEVEAVTRLPGCPVSDKGKAGIFCGGLPGFNQGGFLTSGAELDTDRRLAFLGSALQWDRARNRGPYYVKERELMPSEKKEKVPF